MYTYVYVYTQTKLSQQYLLQDMPTTLNTLTYYFPTTHEPPRATIFIKFGKGMSCSILFPAEQSLVTSTKPPPYAEQREGRRVYEL